MRLPVRGQRGRYISGSAGCASSARSAERGFLALSAGRASTARSAERGFFALSAVWLLPLGKGVTPYVDYFDHSYW